MLELETTSSTSRTSRTASRSRRCSPRRARRRAGSSARDEARDALEQRPRPGRVGQPSPPRGDLIRRYPVSLQIIRWDDHIAPSWIKIWLPMAQTLEHEGLRGEKLAFGLLWLIQAAMSVIRGNLEARRISGYAHEVDDPNLASDGDLIAEVFAHVDTVRAEDIFQFEVENIVLAVRCLIERA